ncbi:MAG: hypothetical protein EPO20_16300 [Betaproteobacteria bacterium]|nr:MAG: hypothetical protein EPO20_16300 [Betaproteobacteria bacterium]
MNRASARLHRTDRWARQISAELGSVLLDTLGLAGTIEWHVRRFQKVTGVRYELTMNDAAGLDLPEDYAATIFDIYNEALSNVARHAGASRYQGHCEVADASNGGTTITVSLPIPRIA